MFETTEKEAVSDNCIAREGEECLSDQH